ncbi:Ig domain-containing protein [Lachnospiraceae bacterium MD1]|uniref:Ig domain-containing protein n=1 Tax=Variimorphobacter saccharofermentans TaxID=2755051 RepID=A0A839JXV0_9FIRM|nr:Ig-like domain-containing protein [Variimorphobacter saccharofermentans]MBB2181449.1 Ig domain-containing protein [Variimorphobacter saccharofermentans]
MKKILSFLLVFVFCLSLIAPSTASAATIKLNKTSLSLNVGSTYTLKLTGTKSTVKWSTSDKKIATVTNGKVKAVSTGKATITATANKKKYTCKVTVKKAFNSKDALKNLVASETDLGNGVIVILENKYSHDIRLEATCVYYDESGDMIGKSSADNYYFNAGNSCAIYLYGPYDGNFNDVPYSNYKITYKVEETSSYYTSNLKDIKVEANFGVDNVMAEVTNTGNKEAEFTVISVVFYKNNNVVGYSYTYADVKEPGSTEYIDFSLPRDDNFDIIPVDDFEIFVNYSYK